MKIISHLLSYFTPSELQNLKTDELLSALGDLSVRKHWLWSVLEEMKEINRRTHVALMNGELAEKFDQESGRLQGIDFALRQILNSKNSMALDKRHNRTGDDPDVAVQPV